MLIHPQAYDPNIRISKTEELDTGSQMLLLFFLRSRISGTIVMSRKCEPDRFMVLHRYIDSPKDGSNQIFIDPFRQDKVRAGLGYGINMLNGKTLLQVADNGQLNPAIHTIDCSAETHYPAPLYVPVH